MASLRQSIHHVGQYPLLLCTSETDQDYPAEGTGSGSWASAYQKAREFVDKLTPAEKLNLTTGYATENGCSGNIPPIERLGFPGMCVSDAGNGLVRSDMLLSRVAN